MDAFYASVELLRRPELAGCPVIVGGRGDPGARGVVTTASYEARAYGVKSGMPLRTAARLCPQAVFLPADFDEYRRLSRRFKAAVARIASAIEDRGIDEIYIDLSSVPGVEVEGGGPLAREIKHEVYQHTGLSCSIAVAPNKLLAKIASELDKPDGLTLLRPDDLETRIWPLPAKRVNGIGPKAAARLEALGIRTIGDIARADLAWLVEHFGANYGAWLHRASHGRDEREVVTESEPRSISRETTFERDLSATRDRAELSAIFTDLCVRLAGDLQRKGYAGRTIGIKLRFDNFTTVTRDQTIETPTQDAAAIRRAAGECLKRVPLARRIRLLGVRMGTLTPATVPRDTG